MVGCTALAVFKALIGRTKDWADIEEMVAMGELDVADALAWISEIGAAQAPAAARMKALAA